MKNRPYPLRDVESVADLRELVLRAARLFGDRTAFSYLQDNQRVDVSFTQFERDVRAFGTMLLKRDRPAEKIAVVGENSYWWIVVCLATLSAGQIIVPIDKECRPDETLALIRRSGASLVAYSNRLSEELTAAIKQGDSLCLQTDVPAMIESGAAALTAGDGAFDAVRIDPQALAALFFTSGTTGVAKGVMLSHQNFASDVCAAWQYIDMDSPTMLVLPLHHTFALNTSVLCALHKGMACVINSGLTRLSQEIKEFRPDSMFVVPLFLETFHRQVWSQIRKQGKTRTVRLMMRLTNALDKVGIDVRRRVFRSVLDGLGGRISLFITGGAPVDFECVKDFRAFGIQVLNGYGITECSPIVAVNRDHYFRDGSTGLPLTCNSVTIAEPDGDGIGEICVGGANVMLGYYEDPTATAATLRDGVFSTGDLGRIDTDGFLHITGRLKNLIITNNGENVSPEELEELLYRLDLVEEVCVFDRAGTITAEVFPNASAAEGLSSEQVAAALKDEIKKINQTLPVFKRIKGLELRDTEFEKTSTKKIKR